VGTGETLRRDQAIHRSGDREDRTPAASTEGGQSGNQNAKKKNGDTHSVVVSPKPKRRTQTEQRIARLKRDFPHIAQSLADGLFASVAEAWRVAGLEKPRDLVREALRLVEKMTPAERKRFLVEVNP
jgi:hypothetical protein